MSARNYFQNKRQIRRSRMRARAQRQMAGTLVAAQPIAAFA